MKRMNGEQAYFIDVSTLLTQGFSMIDVSSLAPGLESITAKVKSVSGFPNNFNIRVQVRCKALAALPFLMLLLHR